MHPRNGSGWHRRNVDTEATAARRKQYASPEHRQLRKRWQRVIDDGQAFCWRCGAWLPPGCAWHLGHNDTDRSIYEGAECPPCNLRTAARKGRAVQTAAQQVTRLEW